MPDVWEVLCAAGLPIGALRRVEPPLSETAVRDAVATLAAGRPALTDFEAEPTHAWLSAWRHHWPQSFREILGDHGERLLAVLAARPLDENRRLKLRRIAVENLSRLL